MQGLPDDPLSEVSYVYEQVRKHYKDTSYYERELRAMKSYMDQGNELYEGVKDLVEEPAGEENTDGQTDGEQDNGETGGSDA